MIKEIKERHSYVGTPAGPCIVQLPVNGKPTEFDVTEQMKEACTILVPEILQGVTALISSFDPEFQERLRGRVLIAGGCSLVKGLAMAIEESMNKDLGGGKVICIEEPIYGGANGALKIAHDMPGEFWERLK